MDFNLDPYTGLYVSTDMQWVYDPNANLIYSVMFARWYTVAEFQNLLRMSQPGWGTPAPSPYPSIPYPAPQYPAPQYPAPQYPAPQYPAPQYLPAPQYPAYPPQRPAPAVPQYPTPDPSGGVPVLAPNSGSQPAPRIGMVGERPRAAPAYGSVPIGGTGARVLPYGVKYQSTGEPAPDFYSNGTFSSMVETTDAFMQPDGVTIFRKPTPQPMGVYRVYRVVPGANVGDLVLYYETGQQVSDKNGLHLQRIGYKVRKLT